VRWAFWIACFALVGVSACHATREPQVATSAEVDECRGVPAQARPTACTDADACSQACEGGDVEACAVRAAALRKQDPARSAELLEQACRKGALTHCADAAMSFDEGRGVARDEQRAQPLYLLGCCGGDGIACDAMGVWYYFGKRAPRDQARALRFWERGCVAPRYAAEPCLKVAEILAPHKHRPADQARAERLLIPLCAGSLKAACFEMGALYDNAPALPERARGTAVLAAECEHGDGTACWSLAVLFTHGHAVPADKKRGAALAARACERGEERACAALKR
jgi:TPR repeat protein